MDSQRLMLNIQNLENEIDDLKFVLMDSGFELKAIKIEPKLSWKIRQLIQNKGVELI